MSHDLHEFRVIATGHTHAGKPLAVGATVRLRADQAARYPGTFAPIDARPIDATPIDATPPAAPPRRLRGTTLFHTPRPPREPNAAAAALPNPPQE